MNNTIKEIQEEINLLMSSNIAKFSDKQLVGWELCSKIGKSNVGKTNYPTRPVEQYSLDGEYIQTFESLSAASKYVNRSNKSLRESITGKSKTCGGYIWKYKQD